jgi:hypothetical protein
VVGDKHCSAGDRVALNIRRPKMKTTIAAITLALAVQASPLWAQSTTSTTSETSKASLTTEAAVSTGVSTEENISAAAVQLRAFGDVRGGVRFFTEGAWAARSDVDSDAFGAAYPYTNRFQVIEAYGERLFQPRHAVVGVRGGRYRTPFGISSGSDHGYTGFLRAPLIRYDGYFALSNNFLEHGGAVFAGVPRLTVEASVGRPADVGSAIRRPGVDTVIRVQSFVGPLIAGVSRIRTSPYLPELFAHGKSVFTGIDVRWMYEGVQLRGEWITGRPFDGTTTRGWYADAMVHRASMGPVTAVARIERLDYDTDPPFALHARRQTIGARIRVLDALSVQLNVMHQTGELSEEYGAAAFDVGVTYSLRHAFHHD